MEQRISDLERLESLKAESLGWSTFTETYLSAIVINYFLIESDLLEFLTVGLKSAIILLSGFLFAITYCYIIRRDNNLYLEERVVLVLS